MDQVVTNFRNQLTFKGKVNEDNYVFKLVSKISVGICIACAAIVASNTYIGDPIHCNKDDSIDQKMFEAHCWIHGTFHLPDEYKVDRTQYCSYNEVIINMEFISSYLTYNKFKKKKNVDFSQLHF